MKRYGTRGKEDEKSPTKVATTGRRSRRGKTSINGDSDEEEEENSPSTSGRASLGKRKTQEETLKPETSSKRTRTQEKSTPKSKANDKPDTKGSPKTVNGKTPTRSTRSKSDSPPEPPAKQSKTANVKGVTSKSASTNGKSTKTVTPVRQSSRSARSNNSRSIVVEDEDSDDSDDSDDSVQEIEEIDDSGDESDADSEGSVQEIEDSDEEDDLEDGEISFANQPSDTKKLEATILALQKEYEKKLQQKEEEIQRLKNDLKWKDEQVSEINTLAEKNMNLESRISQMLTDPECYDEEVVKFKAKTEKPAKKDTEKTKKKAEPEKSTPEKSAKKGEGKKSESAKGKKEDEPSPKKEDEPSPKKDTPKKDKKTSKEKQAEEKKSDDEKNKTPKRKRKEEAEKPETGRSKSKRGRKKEEEEEEKGEDIDTLFVSDDEDDDVIDVTPEEAKKDEEPPKGKGKTKETKDDSKDKGASKDKGKDKEKDKEEEEKDEKSDKDKDGEKDEDDSDDDDDKHKGRKQIRKLMTTKKLAEETVQAAKEEKERRQRVKKLRELHIRVDEKPVKDKAPVTSKLILATKNNDMKTPLVTVHNKLVRKLKPHQVDAVEFMWDNVIESMDNFKAKKDSGGNGCILAHCMGLGKTLSVITFIHTLMTHKCVGFKTCLVVAPLNTVLNWKQELTKWLDKKERLPIYELASCKNNHQRAEELQKWTKKGGVMIMGYQIFRILVTSNTRSKKKKQIFDQSLQNPGPDVVVCDEGHMLKNDASLVAKCMNQVKTPRRIVLTGTPLQNNLTEYHCMVNFVKPNLLGTRKEFNNRFVNPITNGQHADSTAYDVKLMKRRAHVLHEMLSGCVQRRDYSALVKFLPPKEEYVISVRLSPLQMDLYKKYLERLACPTDPTKTLAGASLFSDYQHLMRVWTHPWVLRMNEIREEKKSQYDDDEDEEESDFETESEDDTTTSASTTDDEDAKGNKGKNGKSAAEKNKKKDDKKEEEDEDDDDSDVIEIDLTPRRSSRRGKGDEKSEPANKKGNDKPNEKDAKAAKKSDKGEKGDEGDSQMRKSKAAAGEMIKNWKGGSKKKDDDTNSDDSNQKKKEDSWWSGMFNEEEHKKNLELSGKLVLMFEILRMAQTFGDKVLVFSQSLLSLDLIEDFLAYKNAEYEESKSKKGPKKKSAPTLSSWVKDEDYVRMDGSTGAFNRKKLTEEFNKSENKRLRLFLISTRAGGLGINLDSANRVIIFDASWNPSHDVQSIFRVYRFGQEKPVCVYRFLAQGTMEEKIYERQVTKETLSQRVIDENQIDRHFTASDLQELYIFKPARLDDPEEKNRPTPKIPKDLILTELLSNKKEWIVGYHEHDSLLEKRPDEDLSEEERQKAWEEYERDKKGLYAYRSIVQNPTYNSSYNTNMFGNRSLPTNPQFQTMSMYRPIRSAPMPGPSTAPMLAPGTIGLPQPSTNANFQVSQLPRVVQEILKYNPNISPHELQDRLQAFLGMHARYTVPGFAVPMANTVTAAGSAPMVGMTMVGSTMLPNPPITAIRPPTTLPFILPAPAPGSQPSRLPLPGKLPANK